MLPIFPHPPPWLEDLVSYPYSPHPFLGFLSTMPCQPLTCGSQANIQIKNCWVSVLEPLDHGPGWVGPQYTVPEPPHPQSGEPRSDLPPSEGSSRLLTPVAVGCRPPERLLLSCHTMLAQDSHQAGAGPHFPLSLSCCRGWVRRSWGSSSNHSS